MSQWSGQKISWFVKTWRTSWSYMQVHRDKHVHPLPRAEAGETCARASRRVAAVCAADVEGCLSAAECAESRDSPGKHNMPIHGCVVEVRFWATMG